MTLTDAPESPSVDRAEVHREIRIEGARLHNLQDITAHIPLYALTVVTGVSGSGKSTLAFDTLYAEGQRRYVSSLSTYARQFLERLPRPDVDRVSSLPPAIAIEQRNRVSNARSTVGTASEVHDHLRLLFTHAGEVWCPDCEAPVESGTVAGVAARVMHDYSGGRLTLAAPIVRLEQESPAETRNRFVRDGFGRVLMATGAQAKVAKPKAKKKSKKKKSKNGKSADADQASGAVKIVEWAEVADDDEALDTLVDTGRLVLDRVAIRDANDEDLRTRVAEAVELSFRVGDGVLWIVPEEGQAACYEAGLACLGCGRSFMTPVPALFSFNSPLGACRSCEGFGRTTTLDLERLVPDPTRSLQEKAIAPFATPTAGRLGREMLTACKAVGVPIDIAWEALSDADREFVIEGDDDWEGVRGFFDWLEGRRYKVQARVLIARYRGYEVCDACHGTRLGPNARAVRVAGRDLGSLAHETLEELLAWTHALALPTAARDRSGRVLSALVHRLELMVRVGLGYISLDRQVRTLSGGEAQRIQLGTALSGGLTASLYVLDEPTIGLHPRDIDRLVGILESIRDRGNTVVVVEHALEVVRAADHVIDIGPGAGRGGGTIVAEGATTAVAACDGSRTGQALRGELLPPRLSARTPSGRLRIEGADQHNLVDVSVEIPLGVLVAITGVSGAGKSTLVREGLIEPFDRVGGVSGSPLVDTGAISQVVVVDQSPATRSPRSNPATVTKAFDGIRRLFAGTREAKRLGVGPGWFSFNVPGGRCDGCEGAGEVVVDMQFLDDIRVPCDDCGGLRYRREVLDVRLDGRNIVDVLALTVDESLEVFAGEGRIARRLEPMQRVGLGYLALGQPLSTLSGGEHQRVRLALALSEPAEGRLFVLDEPTTGLHQADVAVLLEALEALLEQGGSVVVVEHNLDLIARAHHVIDLGPEGGPGGGRIVAEGTPEAVSKIADSHTGGALRALWDGFARD